MAKKPYDVTQRFQEVASRARQAQEKPKAAPPEPTAEELDAAEAYRTRPGAGGKRGDVNLPSESKFARPKSR